MPTFGDSLLQIGMTKFQNSLEQNNKVSMINMMDALQKSKLDNALAQTKIRSQELKNQAEEMALKQKADIQQRNAYNAYQKWKENPSRFKEYDPYFGGFDETTAQSNFVSNNPNSSFGFNDALLDQIRMQADPTVNYATGQITDTSVASDPNFNLSALADPRVTQSQYQRQGNPNDWKDDYIGTSNRDAYGREMLGHTSDNPNMQLLDIQNRDALARRKMQSDIILQQPNVPSNMLNAILDSDQSSLSAKQKNAIKDEYMNFIRYASITDDKTKVANAWSATMQKIQDATKNAITDSMRTELSRLHAETDNWMNQNWAWKQAAKQTGIDEKSILDMSSKRYGDLQVGADNYYTDQTNYSDVRNETQDLLKNPYVAGLLKKIDDDTKQNQKEQGWSPFRRFLQRQIYNVFPTDAQESRLMESVIGRESLPIKHQAALDNYHPDNPNQSFNLIDLFHQGTQKTGRPGTIFGDLLKTGTSAQVADKLRSYYEMTGDETYSRLANLVEEHGHQNIKHVPNGDQSLLYNLMN
jgi:hypothetical protein